MMEVTAQRIEQDYDDHVRMEENYAPRNQPYNYFSSIGEECERRLFYLRTKGEEREPFPLHVKKTLRHGREEERRVKGEMMRMGYDWHEEQGGLAIESLNVRGKYEGKVSKQGGEKISVEIKSTSENLFNSLPAGVEGLKEHVYFRKHVSQFMGYLISMDEQLGIMIYTYRSALRCYDLSVDMAFWTPIADRLERVNGAVDSGVVPERIGKVGRDDVCAFCPFKEACLPDVRNELGGVRFINEPEIEEKLDRLAALHEAHKEYEQLAKWRKKTFVGVDGAVCGKYLIEGKMNRRKGYTVEPSEHWRTKVTTLMK